MLTSRLNCFQSIATGVSCHRQLLLGCLRFGSQSSYCSIGDSFPSCTTTKPLGKQRRHNTPEFEVLVVVNEAAEPKRQPQMVRRFCFGRAIACCGTRWQRPPSLTFRTKRYIAFEPIDFMHVVRSDVEDIQHDDARAGPHAIFKKGPSLQFDP